MDPGQELVTEITTLIRDFGLPVFDGVLPTNEPDFPFLYIGETEVNDSIRKTGTTHTVRQTLHFYNGDLDKRGSFTRQVSDIKQLLQHIKCSDNFMFSVQNTRHRVFPDNLTAKPMMQGLIQVEYLAS